MKKLILRRLITSAVVLVLASTVMFALSRCERGSEFFFQPDREGWGEQYRLDRPYPVQYVDWMFKTVTLDFGQSSPLRFRDGGDAPTPPARTVVSRRIWPTALILLGSVAFAILTGVPLGVLAANSPGSGWDKAGRGFAFIGHVIPIFILGFLLTLASYHAFGNIAAIRGGFQLIPASISLGWLIAAVVFWRTRTAMLEADADGQSGQVGVHGEDHLRIRVGRVVRHLISAPRGFAFMPAAYLITGSLVVESWFTIPGLGILALSSFHQFDFPVIYAVTMLSAAAILGLVFILEILSEALRPREKPAPQEDILVPDPKVPELDGPSYTPLAPTPGPVARFPVFSASSIALIAICAIFAPVLASQGPEKQTLKHRGLPPFSRANDQIDDREHTKIYVLGTDDVGRDELSRIVWSARYSLTVVGIALVGGAVGGILLGTAAGFYGGAIDTALSWLLEFTQAIPLVYVVVASLIVSGGSLGLLAVLFLLYSLPTFAAFIRNEFRRIRTTRFDAATQAAESPALTDGIRQALPDVTRTALVAAAFIAGQLILVEATLNFLGLGVQPPWPTWGYMFRDNVTLTPGFSDATLVLSGIAIVAAVIAANNLGEWLRIRPNSNLQ